jgi:hypothetical protein
MHTYIQTDIHIYRNIDRQTDFASIHIYDIFVLIMMHVHYGRLLFSPFFKSGGVKWPKQPSFWRMCIEP